MQRNKAFPWYNQKLITISINFKAQWQQQQTQESESMHSLSLYKTAQWKVAADKEREEAMSQTLNLKLNIEAEKSVNSPRELDTADL